MKHETTTLPLAADICSTECPFPPADWSGSYNHQLERWEGVVTGGPNTETYTTSGTTGGKDQDYDDDDVNRVSDV